MKSKSILSFAKLGLVPFAALLATTTAQAATYYWDDNGVTLGTSATPNGIWGTNTYWNNNNTTGTVATTNPTTTLLDDVFFTAGTTGAGATGATGSYTVGLGGVPRNVRSVTFKSGTPTIDNGTLNLGNGSVIAVNISTVTGATISSSLAINGSQIFNIGLGEILALNTGTFTRNAGAVLNVQGAGSVNTTMTGLASGSMVNGIVGPWSSFGSSTSMKYATIDGSNNIIGLTGTAAATAADVTDTVGTFNYDVAADGALGAGANVNTLRYTGAVGTITGDLITNGLMNASAGTVTLSGAVTIGSGNELVVNTNGGVTASNAIGGSAGAKLLKTGAGTLTLNGANSFTGAVTINSGTLAVSSVAPAGSNSGLGSYAGMDNGGLILAGGTLSYTGALDGSTDRGFQTTASSTVNIATAGVKLTMGNYEPTVNTTALSVTGGAGSSLELTRLTVSGGNNSTVSPAAGIAARVDEVLFAGGTNMGSGGSGPLTVGTVTSTNLAANLGGAGGTIDTAVNVGTGSFTKSGSGIWTFTGNTFVAGSINSYGAGSFTVAGAGSLNNGSYTGNIGFNNAAGYLTYNSSANQLLSGNITGTGVIGNVAMNGSGILTLSGINTYKGLTKVTNGTLLITGNSSGVTGAATVSTGSTFGGTGSIGGSVTFDSGAKALLSVISPMTLAGVVTYNATEVHLNLPAAMPNGVYTLVNSSAIPVQNGAFPAPVVESGSYGSGGSGVISLSGNKLVLTISGSSSSQSYTSWSIINGVTGGPNGDSDNDGVSNLVEYALADGGDRGVFDTATNTITFTKRGAPYGSDVSYTIQTSTDLGITDPWATPSSGVIENATTISYTFTPSTPVKNFSRLMVLQTP